MRKIIAMLISGVLLMGVNAIAAAAYVYKWTDEEGNVHFSDKPVGKDVELHKIDTVKSTKGGESRKKFMETQKKSSQTQEGEGQTEEQNTGEKQGEMTKEQIAQRKENCERLKKNLASYERTPRLYREDENGERVYLDDKEREEAIAKTRKNMESLCN